MSELKTSASLLMRLRETTEQAAWVRFVDLYTPFLYSIARRLGCQENDAADLVQEVLTLLVRKLPEFDYDPERSFRGWLRTLILNRWRQNRRRHVRAPSAGNGELHDIPAPDAFEAFEEAEYRRYLIRRALECLEPEFPPLSWAAFREYAVIGRKATEVAAELRLSVGSVYASKSRVLGRLRQELAGLLD